MNKNALIALVAVIVLALAGFGAYAFITSPTKAPTPIITPTPTPAPTPVSDIKTEGAFKIDSSKSKATFSIFEMLRGEPKTVLGTTDQVTGEFKADMSDLSKAELGDIRINARTFKTDSESRDNTTRRAILKTEDDANEFIVFKTTKIEGLPASTTVGTELTFTIAGDLTIAGVTKPAIFTGTGTFTSETEFSGKADTKVKRSDFNLIVPSLPFLADVADEVPLSIEFVATR